MKTTENTASAEGASFHSTSNRSAKQLGTRANRHQFIAILMAGMSLAATAPLMAEPTGGKPAVPGAKAPAQAAKAVLYQRQREGYFVKNTLKQSPSGVTCLWLETQDAFDAVFQKTPPLMNQPHKEDVDLAGKLAFAVVLNTKAYPKLTVSAVTLKDGVLTVAYDKTAPEDSTATFSVPLLVTVDKAALANAGGAKTVRFVENGKEVGTANKP